MGRKSIRYNASQQAKVANLAAIHSDYVLAKANLRAEIEAAFQQKLRDFELRESRAMNEALNEGVAKSTISQIVSVTNWNSLSDKFALTADEFYEEPEVPQIEVEFNGVKGMFKLNWTEWEGVRTEYNPQVMMAFDEFARARGGPVNIDPFTWPRQLQEDVQTMFNTAAQQAVDNWKSKEEK